MGFRSSDATRLYQTGAPAPHAATKAGVIMLTRQVANEVGKGYRGGAEGNRTPDLRRAKAALCETSALIEVPGYVDRRKLAQSLMPPSTPKAVLGSAPSRTIRVTPRAL